MDTLWIILLVTLALIGAPLFAIFGAASMLLFAGLPDTSITGAANDVFSEKFADSPLLVTIPLFTFAGYVLAESGTPHRLVTLSRAWLGWMPGGLAMVCLMASAFFTTFTGGSGITIVAIGGLLYPALLADKYEENFSLGLVTTGGSLGLLFPPSVPMIIYGVVAGIMIEKLFLAGLIPGIITVAALATYSSITGIKAKMRRTKFDASEAIKTLWEAKWEALLPVALLGGMYSGLMRIHEAAAFTAIYTLIIEVFVYRDVSFRKDLPRIIRESMTLVGAILAILATAIGFTAFLIQARVPMMILDAMEGLIQSQVMFLIALNVFLIGVGMLMDIFSAIVVVVPLIVPIAQRFGVDPYHLGIVFLLNLEIGYMTPPVGLNLFISSFRFNKPITQLYRAVLPFIGLLGLALIIVTYIPALSTWIPNMMESTAVDLDAPIEGMEDEGDATGLDLDQLEGDDVGFDLDDLEVDDEVVDLDALEGEDPEGELDLDALEEQDEDLQEELDLEALEAEGSPEDAQ
ncbi:MAG TPA: TRAP transporter large permease subunit [Polyangiales bacterium]|nr:TRAP transporter large permease subunit [Polyangiales bacterium]